MSLPIVGQPGPKATLTPDEVAAKIRESIPDAVVVVNDLTGTQDHYQVQVTSQAFEGLMLLEQHKLVNQSLEAELKANIVHALTIKTKTP